MNSILRKTDEDKKGKNAKGKNNIKFNLLAIVSIIIFCVAISPITLQNDTFYTIKIGEEIVNTKTIDMQDAFSWHNLPYTYPHWAYDVIIYLIYNIGGMAGIYISTILLSSVLGLTIYATINKFSKNKVISFIVTIGTMFLIKSYIAARAQLVTFILFTLTILLIEKFMEKPKIKYAVGMILISIAIANLHCAVWPFFFVIFLPYVGEYVIFTMVDFISKLQYKIYMKISDLQIKRYKVLAEKCSGDKKKHYNDKIEAIIIEKENFDIKTAKILNNKKQRRKHPYKIKYEKNKTAKWLVVIMCICVLTGLLTPLGDTPYTYLYKTMKGNTTKSISEHLPLTLIDNTQMLIVLTSVIAILIFTDVKIRLKDLFMIAGLTLLMFMTRRQESMLILLGSPIIARIITELFDKYDKGGLNKLEDIMVERLGAIATILLIVLMSAATIKPKLKNKFVNPSAYPVNASEYIINNLDVNTIRLFNEYNYGSYLLFKGIPVFIDSRADLYAPEFNGEKGKDGKYEGQDIFSDYMDTATIGKYYEDTFKKYDITHVILYKSSKLNMLISRDDKYKELYTDSKFVIYERNSMN